MGCGKLVRSGGVGNTKEIQNEKEDEALELGNNIDKINWKV